MSNKTKRKGSTPSDFKQGGTIHTNAFAKGRDQPPSKKGAEGSGALEGFTVPSGSDGKGKLGVQVTGPSGKGSAARSGIGFVLTDSEQRRIYFNAEAARILAYPAPPRRGKPLELLLANKIRTILPQRKGNSRPDSQTEFLSGRRRYLCRAFSFSIRSAMPHTHTAMCLERMILERLPSPGIAKQFCLTPRELETAELLVLGFANKEIAARISISPNTVKNFVRMIMVKMRVTSRSGIVARILGHGTPEPKLPGLPSLSDPRRSSGKRMED